MILSIPLKNFFAEIIGYLPLVAGCLEAADPKKPKLAPPDYGARQGKPRTNGHTTSESGQKP